MNKWHNFKTEKPPRDKFCVFVIATGDPKYPVIQQVGLVQESIVLKSNLEILIADDPETCIRQDNILGWMTYDEPTTDQFKEWGLK